MKDNKVWFTNRKCEPLEIEYQINLTLVIDYYPLVVSLDKRGESCKTIDDPYDGFSYDNSIYFKFSAMFRVQLHQFSSNQSFCKSTKYTRL